MVQAGRYNTYGREIKGTGKRAHMYRYRKRDQLYKNEVISREGILLSTGRLVREGIRMVGRRVNVQEGGY
jgi:hypothetical protein